MFVVVRNENKFIGSIINPQKIQINKKLQVLKKFVRLEMSEINLIHEFFVHKQFCFTSDVDAFVICQPSFSRQAMSLHVDCHQISKWASSLCCGPPSLPCWDRRSLGRGGGGGHFIVILHTWMSSQPTSGCSCCPLDKSLSSR